MLEADLGAPAEPSFCSSARSRPELDVPSAADRLEWAFATRPCRLETRSYEHSMTLSRQREHGVLPSHLERLRLHSEAVSESMGKFHVGGDEARGTHDRMLW